MVHFFQLQATEAVLSWLNGNEFFIKKIHFRSSQNAGRSEGSKLHWRTGEETSGAPALGAVGTCTILAPQVPVLSQNHDLATTTAPEGSCFCYQTQWQSRFYTIILHQAIHS